MMLEQLCKALLAGAGTEVNGDMRLHEMLADLDRQDAKTARHISACHNARLALEMLRTDYELRHKLPDVWQYHVSRCEKELYQHIQSLRNHLNETGKAHLVAIYLAED
ncbi:MAG: hypothetical protein IPM52_01710 [Bacteroidetes bacterium]|nr:hypothetical protein [Bacteroidota bacterium]